MAEAQPPRLGLTALFLRFLRFGAFAFGGPVAQIAMIRRELVDEERWIDGARFNRLLAVMQVLPGPEAHELCVHLGIRARGRIGGVLAGLGFMLPGLVLMLLSAWAYSSFAGRSTVLVVMFMGVQATVLAVIVRAVHRIGEHILTDPALWCLAGAAAVATWVGVTFWLVLPAAGLAYAAVASRRWIVFALIAALVILAASVFGNASTATGGPADPTTATTLALFLAGLKGGLLTFGGAYTAIPFVRADTVGRGWATDAQFLDGVGLANVLPAPLVIFATFVGWMSGGLVGALSITVGMFVPAFAFSLVLYERLEAVVEDLRLQTLLTGVAAAVVGIIAVTALQLGQAALEATVSLPLTAGLFTTALIIVYVWKSRFSAPLVLGLGAITAVLML